MARLFNEYYSEEVRSCKKKYFACLPEKAKRHFLGQEYLELGVGSQHYLCRVFGSSRDTIRKGAAELKAEDFTEDYSRQRESGGGRKKKRIPKSD